MNLVFVNSHPIQYFAPLYQFISKNERVNLNVIYLSDETVEGYRDAQFGVNVRWDIPLLEGYRYTFLKNYSWKPSLKNGFWGLINWGVVSEFKKHPRNTIVVVHGWAYFSNFLAIWAAAFLGLTVCLRGETPLSHELKTVGIKKKIRSLLLSVFLFPFVDKFLFIGEQNRRFYKKFGVKDKDLVFTPYSVDNDRFQKEFNKKESNGNVLRKRVNANEDDFIILFSGKYIVKKRPMDLLKAFHKIDNEKIFLIMMGEGQLRVEMEKYIAENKVSKVTLTGFVNQSEVSDYYSIADVFVMCSDVGETWGLSVNEAMNFKLPIIVSDMTGCSDDLVKQGVNGYVFKTGNVNELANRIKEVVSTDSYHRRKMGDESYRIVSRYSYKEIVEALMTLEIE